MNYLKHYCNLIRKAENRIQPEGYTEKHHTFPKSIFGKNNRVVVLTAREHYVAHALLEKIFIKRYGLYGYYTKKMIHAHCMMKSGNYYNSYLYEFARIRRSVIMEKNDFRVGKKHNENTKEKIKEKALARNINLAGEKNGMFGKKHTLESKKKMSEANNNKGRRWWTNGVDNTMSKQSPGENWRIGRTNIKKYKLPGRIGAKWWNNGVENRCCKGCPGQNWKLGRVKNYET
jgi:hypothetical protein